MGAIEPVTHTPPFGSRCGLMLSLVGSATMTPSVAALNGLYSMWMSGRPLNGSGLGMSLSSGRR